jgi:hypothetical protein
VEERLRGLQRNAAARTDRQLLSLFVRAARMNELHR